MVSSLIKKSPITDSSDDFIDKFYQISNFLIYFVREHNPDTKIIKDITRKQN